MFNDTVLLKHLADQLSTNPEFLASHLQKYMALERLDEYKLAEKLETDLKGLSRLALCKAPNPALPDFVERVKNIAEYAGVPSSELAQLLRYLAFRERQVSPQGKIVALSPRSHLMAAREKSDDQPDESPEKPV